MAAIRKKRLNVTMSTPYLDGIDQLLSDGLYASEAEIIKDALRRLFIHYELACISDAYPASMNTP